MPKIELEITRINKVIIYFESGLFLSLIDTVQVFISIDTVNFHFVNIPSSFLLCLKDMDILDIN